MTQFNQKESAVDFLKSNSIGLKTSAIVVGILWAGCILGIVFYGFDSLLTFTHPTAQLFFSTYFVGGVIFRVYLGGLTRIDFKLMSSVLMIALFGSVILQSVILMDLSVFDTLGVNEINSLRLIAYLVFSGMCFLQWATVINYYDRIWL